MATAKAARKALLAYALKRPGAWVDHPWEEDVAKVGKKIFVFFGRNGPELFVGVKLPRSLLYARAQKFVQNFGYGMDKSGWVSARFAESDHVPVELLRSWIYESYEAIVATALPKKRASAPTMPPVRAKQRAAKTRR